MLMQFSLQVGNMLLLNHSGYMSEEYAESFREFGEPCYLPRSQGWILQRRISSSEYSDSIGLYPVFCCEDWRELSNDIGVIAPSLVSLCVIPDPFGNYSADLLNATFDFVRPYKERYIVALDKLPEHFISRHHRKCSQKGLNHLQIDRCETPLDYLDEWIDLYSHVCRRHNIRDFRAFSPEAFSKQLQVPGLVMFRAKHEGRTVAIHQWMTHGNFAYGHLAGHRDEAYRLNASYALYWHALHWFYSRVEYVDLGATAGIDANAGDGLAFFKKGWSTDIRTGYFCGRVLRPDIYAELSRVRRSESENFFPAYRTPAYQGKP